MSAEQIARILVDIGAVELRADPASWFTWTSGRRAPIYCDNRLLLSHPDARAAVADALCDSIRERAPDVQVIAGTATAGIPHAAWVAERLKLPMVYVRSEAKGHGKGKRVEGRLLGGERVVLIEDLISFGGSAVAAIEGLRAENADVIGLQAIFSYGFRQAADRLQSAGVPWSSLSDYDALLRLLPLQPAQVQLLLEWRGR
jgi:orotate phosphoribosyltransferase